MFRPAPAGNTVGVQLLERVLRQLCSFKCAVSVELPAGYAVCGLLGKHVLGGSRVSATGWHP
jgi:hypothetical protein